MPRASDWHLDPLSTEFWKDGVLGGWLELHLGRTVSFLIYITTQIMNGDGA